MLFDSQFLLVLDQSTTVSALANQTTEEHAREVTLPVSSNSLHPIASTALTFFDNVVPELLTDPPEGNRNFTFVKSTSVVF